MANLTEEPSSGESDIMIVQSERTEDTSGVQNQNLDVSDKL